MLKMQMVTWDTMSMEILWKKVMPGWFGGVMEGSNCWVFLWIYHYALTFSYIKHFQVCLSILGMKCLMFTQWKWSLTIHTSLWGRDWVSKVRLSSHPSCPSGLMTFLCIKRRLKMLKIDIQLLMFIFRPHSTDSFTHRKMTLSLADRSSKAQKVKVLPIVGKNPESQRSELIKVLKCIWI